MSRRTSAVRAAYVAADALAIACPTCHAAIGRPCVRIDDNGKARYRKVPCVKRCRGHLDVDVIEELPEPPIDFAEPRHTIGEDDQ